MSRWGKLDNGKIFKTNPERPTGLAVCDICGFNVNGGDLRKYVEYVGSPRPDYGTPTKFIGKGGGMSQGGCKANGLMVCPDCLDVPNPHTNYVRPKSDPYPALGNRPDRDYFDPSAVAGNLLMVNGEPVLLENGEYIYTGQ